ncbi:MAG: hypothetical protein NDJ90_03050 [Oligoflexia bacterium]|nr:hypothetical protein [Oligoflexia bacterium]
MSLASAPESTDRAQDVVDTLRYETLEAMRQEGLEKAYLPANPWSGSYWPHYKGILARRYLDPGFPDSKDYRTNHRYLRETMGKMHPAVFSPAEKYDLLVGDPDFTLTRTVLDWGEKWAREREALGFSPEEWMGICYGWSSASLMVPRPERAVTVLAADGMTWVEFLPSDIKGLATLLWDQALVPRRWAGGICREAVPRTDEFGRPLGSECLDSNPATWHLALVNQIGVSRRSLVADIKSDERIFNQPLVGYTYRYFNPKYWSVVQSLPAGKVAIRDFPEDYFSIFRSPRATQVIGVEMVIVYVNETHPSSSRWDQQSEDDLESRVLLYDLELDAEGKIVGGEWYSEVRPDFVWVPPVGTRAVSIGDSQLKTPSWNGTVALPRDWSETARWTSRYAQPLAAIVETLSGFAAASGGTVSPPR